MPRVAPAPRSAPAALLAGAALLFVGCSAEEEGQTYGTDAAVVGDDEHVHAEADHGPGPHDGLVVELTTDHSLHGELVMDSDDPARGRFYVLAGDLKTPVPADSVEIFFDDPVTNEETNLKLDPVGEANADSAEWSFLLDRLPGRGEGALEGRIVVHVGDEEREALFNTAHDEHDHDHGAHDHGAHDHGGDEHGHEHGDHE